MTASESSPRKGQECDGASDYEQQVLRQRLRSQSEFLSDELRLRRGDDLREYLERVRRARVELGAMEVLLERCVDAGGVEEGDE